MKCLCGYQKSSDYEFEEELKTWQESQDEYRLKGFPVPKMPINGDEEWISSNSSINFQIYEAGYSSDGAENKTIYACPKCGTLKIDI